MATKGTKNDSGKLKKLLQVFLDLGNLCLDSIFTPLKGQQSGLRAWAGSQETTITQLIFEDHERRSSAWN